MPDTDLIDENGEDGGELDFTKRDPPPPNSLAPPPADKPFDPEPVRERVRKNIAYLLTVTVCGLAIGAFILLATGWISSDELDHAQFFFTPVITLAGTALGFYFGGRANR